MYLFSEVTVHETSLGFFTRRKVRKKNKRGRGRKVERRQRGRG